MARLRRTLLLAGLAAAFLCVEARASFVPVLQNGSPTAGPGSDFTFTYNLVFATAVTNGVPDERLESGDFITLYDVGPAGFTPTGTTPADITFSTALVGLTAAGTLPNDDPLAPNVTFTYTGGTLTADTTFVVTLTSPFNETRVDSFTGTDTRNSGAQAGTKVSQLGVVTVPGAAVPEPASIVLMGLGGLGVVGLARRKRAQA